MASLNKQISELKGQEALNSSQVKFIYLYYLIMTNFNYYDQLRLFNMTIYSNMIMIVVLTIVHLNTVSVCQIHSFFLQHYNDNYYYFFQNSESSFQMAPGVEEELQQLKEKLSQAETSNKILQQQLWEAEQRVREEGHAEQVCFTQNYSFKHHMSLS